MLNFDDTIVHFRLLKDDIAKLTSLTHSQQGHEGRKWNLLIANYDASDMALGYHAPDRPWNPSESITLRPYEGKIYVTKIIDAPQPHVEENLVKRVSIRSCDAISCYNADFFS